MKIPFTKAHGAKNDFLLTWVDDAPAEPTAEMAVRICDRHTGAGADGWLLVSAGGDGVDGSIRLFNSDGSEPEMSGNGTRCAGALLIAEEKAGETIRIGTGAGVKDLRLIERHGNAFQFEMNMGKPRLERLAHELAVYSARLNTTILNVGNPQCVVLARELPADWREVGAGIEKHPFFPNRTNVSFVVPVDEHTIDVKFFERGCGETMSSGTGSTGAAVAAIVRGLAKSPVKVLTPAGPIDVRWEGSDAWLVGPAEIIAKGEFYL
jgi:diaminopimelate epimerase